MDEQKHIEHLGGLVGNLQSLEFVLRWYFQNLPSARPFGFPEGTDIYSFRVGESVPENELTSYETLGDLIVKFNANMTDVSCHLDTRIIQIRNAIAHGRVSASEQKPPLRLIKYSRGRKGYVRVEYNELMDEAWFKECKRLTYDALTKVAKLMPKHVSPAASPTHQGADGSTA